MSDIFDALLEQIINGDKPVSRAKALKKLASEPAEKGMIPTINRLRDTYGISFESWFVELVEDGAKGLSMSQLVPATINPMVVIASEHSVFKRQIRQLLRLRKAEFEAIVQHNENEPIVLVPTPHGLIAANGHHRLRALQLLNVRRIRLHAVPPDNPLNDRVSELFGEFGYDTLDSLRSDVLLFRSER